MPEMTRLSVLLALGAALAACAETPFTPTDDIPPEAPVRISTAPDPTRAVPSTGKTFTEKGETREYAFVASFDLIFRGNPDNDLAVEVDSDSVTVQQLGTADGPGGGVERERWVRESRPAAVTLIEPGGETSRAFDVWYTLPNGGRQALVAVTLNFKDTRGTEFTLVHQVPIQP